jgi:MraZ protein
VTHLLGTYECKVDAKGRLMLPSALKKQLQSVLADGLVLKRSLFQNCIEMHPMNEWEKMMERVNSINRFKKKNNDFIRKFMAGVKMVEVDANARILIPKELTHFADIKKEIVLTSNVNMVEIWDKESYEKAIDQVDDFAELAEEVMGDDDNS